MTTTVYIGSKGSALADYLTIRYGLEVPIGYELPEAKFLPSTMPRYPRAHDRFYADGGSHWPDRWVLSEVA